MERWEHSHDGLQQCPLGPMGSLRGSRRGGIRGPLRISPWRPVGSPGKEPGEMFAQWYSRHLHRHRPSTLLLHSSTLLLPRCYYYYCYYYDDDDASVGTKSV